MDEIMKFLMTLPDEDRILAVEQAFADKARFDKLQKLTERQTSSGTVLLEHDADKGWRLYETASTGADSDVRGAVDRFFAELDPEGDALDA